MRNFSRFFSSELPEPPKLTCLFGVPGAALVGGGGGAFVLRPFLVDTSILSVLDEEPTEEVEEVEPCKIRNVINLTNSSFL